MPRETVTFQPAKSPHLSGALKPVCAEKTAYGLVIHPTIQFGPHRKFGFWDVSDPVTGCRVAYGAYPGREGAIAALVHTAFRFRKSPGGFRRTLATSRERLRQKIAIEQRFSQPSAPVRVSPSKRKARP